MLTYSPPLPPPSPHASLPQAPPDTTSIAEQLLLFDESWLRYLDQFAAWKGEDAASLEAELGLVATEHRQLVVLDRKGLLSTIERGGLEDEPEGLD